MAVPEWPDSLPQRPMTDGYVETLRDGRLRSAMEIGPGKMRRRYTNAARPVTLNFVLTTVQRFRLDRFWDEDTYGGTLPFYIPDPARNGAQIVTSDGAILTTNDGSVVTVRARWLALFAEPPRITPFALQFQADVTLSVLRRP